MTSIQYEGPRSEQSKALIRDQVYNVAANLFKQGIEFDEDNCNWFVAPKYRLPRIWGGRTTPLLIVFPTLYPEIPPIGCYVRKTITQSANGHLYNEAYHNAYKEPLRHGWKWYCVYVSSGAWQPARIRRLGDWRQGDNLWTYLTLINEALAGKGN